MVNRAHSKLCTFCICTFQIFVFSFRQLLNLNWRGTIYTCVSNTLGCFTPPSRHKSELKCTFRTSLLCLLWGLACMQTLSVFICGGLIHIALFPRVDVCDLCLIYIQALSPEWINGPGLVHWQICFKKHFKGIFGFYFSSNISNYV